MYLVYVVLVLKVTRKFALWKLPQNFEIKILSLPAFRLVEILLWTPQQIFHQITTYIVFIVWGSECIDCEVFSLSKPEGLNLNCFCRCGTSERAYLMEQIQGLLRTLMVTVDVLDTRELLEDTIFQSVERMWLDNLDWFMKST